jgi:hypothetical protein
MHRVDGPPKPAGSIESVGERNGPGADECPPIQGDSMNDDDNATRNLLLKIVVLD